MFSKPKISVIIPIYNVEKYLDKCLMSVRKQTLKDIEIICVDDCSPDNSYKIVEKHAKQDPRITFIRHEKNMGLGGARNTAIRQAKADYIASVDSDDFMLPEMLETLWRETENGWFDIVCCGFNCVDKDGGILSQHEYAENQFVNDGNELNIFTALNPAFWNKLWRKSLFTDHQIFFPNWDYYEDMSTTPRILAKSKYIKIIKDRLYQYLIRPESISTSYGEKHIVDYFKGFEIIFDFLEKNKIFDVYEEDFYTYVRNHILLHSKNILSSSKYAEEKAQYLQTLLIFRDGFLDNFELVKTTDLGELINLLKPSSSRRTYKERYNVLFDQFDEQSEERKELKLLLDKTSHKLSKVDQERDGLKNQLEQSTVESENYKNELHLFKEQYKKDLVHVTKDKEQYKKELTRVTFEKNRFVEKIDLTEKDNEEYRKKLSEVMLSMESYKGELKTLKQQMDARLCLYQKIGVFLFAVITRPTLNRNQSLKLKNHPRQFFKDSKSNFARQYASLLKLDKPLSPSISSSTTSRDIPFNKQIYQALYDLALNRQEKIRSHSYSVPWDLIQECKTLDCCLYSHNLDVFSHVKGSLKGSKITCINESNWGDGEAYLTWGNVFRNSENPRSMEVVNAILNEYKPFFIAEDGFLRSVVSFANKGVPARFQQSYSMVIDDLAPYYSAYQNTRLEQMLNHFDESSMDADYVSGIINKILNSYLSKYNNQPLLDLEDTVNDGVLVIDQVSYDFSVTRGGGKAKLKLMLQSAIEENPGEKIFLKIHPDNIANGSNQSSFYGDLIKNENVHLIDYECNSIALMKYVQKVYVFSSQLGFEAILLGKDVQIFGLPFYAGWGFTQDRHPHASSGRFKKTRRNRLSKEAAFYVAYCLYTRYLDRDRNITSIENAIDILIEERKDYFNENNILDELGVINN